MFLVEIMVHSTINITNNTNFSINRTNMATISINIIIDPNNNDTIVINNIDPNIITNSVTNNIDPNINTICSDNITIYSDPL